MVNAYSFGWCSLILIDICLFIFFFFFLIDKILKRVFSSFALLFFQFFICTHIECCKETYSTYGKKIFLLMNDVSMWWTNFFLRDKRKGFFFFFFSAYNGIDIKIDHQLLIIYFLFKNKNKSQNNYYCLCDDRVYHLFICFWYKIVKVLIFE